MMIFVMKAKSLQRDWGSLKLFDTTAWDKAPNPLWVNEIARERHRHAVMGLKELWGFKLDQCSLLD